ncbi:MAG: hypothetical protein M0T69_01960 [Deltaproteobacteria bacterium]|nr:hypothetical protein [Deltaproteobacteria bacterium]
MGVLTPFLKSFNAGELSPRLGGRLDLGGPGGPKFHDGCRILENAICQVQGPATRRGAFRFVEEVKTSAKATRLIPFEVGTSAAYILEMGDLYFRFYASGARIESGGVPVEVVTPYAEADLFAVHRAQSADLLYLAHTSYPQQKLTRLLADGTSWNLKAINFLPPPTFEDDSDYSGGTIKVALSALTGTGVKVVSSAAVFLAADKDRLLKYLDARASFTAYVGTSEMTAEILDDFPAALIDTTPTATLTTDGGADKTIINFSAAHGISAGQVTAGIWLRLTTGAQAGEMRQVASVTDADTVVLTAAFSVDQTAQNFSKHYAIAAGSWKISGSPVATCTPSVSSPVGAICTLTLGAAGWRASDVTAGKYVKIDEGIVKLTTFTSSTVVSGRIVMALTSVTAAPGGTWSAEVPSWTATHGYPAAVCFYEQRLMFGGSVRQPTTIWGSVSGDYENFSAGVYAGDSLEHALTGLGVNQVRWLVPSKILMGGTAASEFTIRGDGEAALTPTNPRPLPETNHGSSTVMPVKIGPFVLFVQAHGRKVREITYDLQKDTFVAPDLTRFAEHITAGGGIVDMAYQQEPDSILWCVTADGVLLGLTYNREEEVIGWHRHVTDGLFESVAVIPDAVNHRDQLWAVVNRTIGGETKRYVEYLDPDIVVADSFVRYQGAAATVITGLSHLEGEAVDVVADGFVVTGHVVAGGQITLARAASDVTVGLHYETTVEPEPPDYIDDKGRNNINVQKQWAEVILRLYETGLSGVTVNGKTLPPRAGSDPLDTANALFTGDVKTPLLGTTRAGILTIKQTLPLPFTLLAIAGTLDVGD